MSERAFPNNEDAEQRLVIKELELVRKSRLILNSIIKEDITTDPLDIIKGKIRKQNKLITNILGRYDGLLNYSDRQ